MRRFILPLGMTASIALLAGCAQGEVHRAPFMTPNVDSSPEGVRWCGTLGLPDHWQDGTPLGGLSDLAWDSDESRLYLVSDRGWLHQVRPVFSGGELSDLIPLASHRLLGNDDSPLASNDAESLLAERSSNGIRNDTTLLIGFERDHRLQRFHPDGTPTGPPLSPQGLRGAGANRGAEALGRHTTWGPIVGLESPPSGMPEKTTRLFELNTGQEWTYPLADDPGSALTALETHGDGLLALERAYAPPAPLVISLRHVRLNATPDADVTTLARLSTGEGWWLDNFEGLTHLGDNRYLMVSDNNFSALQRTLLTCFALPRATTRTSARH